MRGGGGVANIYIYICNIYLYLYLYLLTVYLPMDPLFSSWATRAAAGNAKVPSKMYEAKPPAAFLVSSIQGLGFNGWRGLGLYG